MSELEIETSVTVQFSSVTQYALSAERGYLSAIYDDRSRKFGISYIYVQHDFRERGIGQALLNRSIELASDVGARVMHATINSREGLETFRSVFDEDSISVEQEGGFRDQDETIRDITHATLWFELSDD